MKLTSFAHSYTCACGLFEGSIYSSTLATVLKKEDFIKGSTHFIVPTVSKFQNGRREKLSHRGALLLKIHFLVAGYFELKK